MKAFKPPGGSAHGIRGSISAYKRDRGTWRYRIRIPLAKARTNQKSKRSMSITRGQWPVPLTKFRSPKSDGPKQMFVGESHWNTCGPLGLQVLPRYSFASVREVMRRANRSLLWRRRITKVLLSPYIPHGPGGTSRNSANFQSHASLLPRPR
jgi:hypothetical protein